MRDGGIDAVEVDIWTHAGFASDASVGHEMADDVTGAVLEAWILSVHADVPSERMLIEAVACGSSAGMRSSEIPPRRKTSDGFSAALVGGALLVGRVRHGSALSAHSIHLLGKSALAVEGDLADARVDMSQRLA